MSTKNPQYITTAKWVRAARKSKGLTQKDLAVELKISKKSLENYESGRIDVPTATAIGVARICEYSPDFFDAGEGQSIKKAGGKTESDPDTKARYMSLLEKTVERLEQENEQLKTQLKKPSTKSKTIKKK
jgi:transcriptional regulator with XRE-family HTH domain